MVEDNSAEGPRLDTEARWRAVLSPVRQHLLMVMEDGRFWTVRELARALGRSPQGLYRHLDALLGVGILEQRATPLGQAFRLPGPLVPCGVGEGEPFAPFVFMVVDRLFREAARAVGRAPGPGMPRLGRGWLISLDAAGVAALEDCSRRFAAEVDELMRRSIDLPDDVERTAITVVIGAARYAAADEGE